MPTQKVAKLRYCKIGNIACTSGVLNETIIRANSVYDPEQAAGGQQPMGFDQWAALYNHYVVLGSKIWLKLIPSTTTVAPAMAGLYLSDGKTLGYTSATEFIEAKKGKNILMGPTSDRTYKMVNKFSAKRYFQVKDVKDNITRLGASVGANPSEEAYFHMWYQTLDSSSATIRYSVVIDYIVAFSEPKDLARS